MSEKTLRKLVADRTLEASRAITVAEEIIREILTGTHESDARWLLKHQIKKLKMAKGLCANVRSVFDREG